MEFPLENPILRFLYWLLNTPGIGAITVAILAGGLLTSFWMSLRWIIQGGQATEREEYAYPTPGLHIHSED